MRIRGIFVAGVFLALSGGMVGLPAYADNLDSANSDPVLPDPPKRAEVVFPASAATAGMAVASPALNRSPELDARACTAQSHCALPSPALDRVIVTPRQIDLSRNATHKHRG
jgi:hypothetical protein